MNKTNKILIGLLVIQGGLVALTWQSHGPVSDPTQVPFLDVSKDAITSITVMGRPVGEELKPDVVELEKANGVWVISGTEGYPIKEDKAKELVDGIVDLKVGEPIATKAANHNNLRVGKDNYGKIVTVTAGDKSHVFLVGSGGNKRVNVRRDGENEVYVGRGIAEYELHTSVRSFIDYEYVKVDADKIASLSVQGQGQSLDFQKSGESWQLATLPPGAAIDDTKVKSFVRTLARITIVDPIGKTVKPEFGLEAGIEVTIQYTDEGEAKTARYVIGNVAGEGVTDHYVKADGNDFVVTMSEWAVKQAKTKTPADFVKEEQPAQN